MKTLSNLKNSTEFDFYASDTPSPYQGKNQDRTMVRHDKGF